MEKNYHKGYWNGEEAKYRVVTIEVGDEPAELKRHCEKHCDGRKRYLWFIPFIGQTRQAIEVTYAGSTFYLDNEDGSGLHKVTTGHGSPNEYHASVYPAKVLGPVSLSVAIQHSASLRYQKHQEVDAAWMELDPEGYPEHMKRMKIMRESIQKMRAGTFFPGAKL